jgi:O-antigen ligase
MRAGPGQFSFDKCAVPAMIAAMSDQITERGRLAGRFGYLGLLVIVLTLPYAVPALWDFVQIRLGMTRGIYLLKPVENQSFYLQFAVLALAVPYLVWRVFAPPARFAHNSIVYLALLFVALQFLSVTQARSPEFTLRKMMMPMACTLGFLLVLTLDLGRREIEKLFLVAVATTIPASLYAVAQSQGWEFLPYSKFISEATAEEVSGKQLISSTFGHPNYLASYITPLAFWAMYFIIPQGARLKRSFGVLALLCIVAALVVGGTRGAWLAFLCAAVPFYLLMTMSPPYRGPLLFAGVTILLVVVVLVFLPNPVVKIQFKLSERLLASKEISNRFYYWMIALEMFKAHPWLGVGYANFNVNFWDAVQVFQLAPDSDYYRFILTEGIRGVSPGYVHNDFLQIAAENGVFALLTWLGIWSVLICQAWETAWRARRSQRPLLLSATFLASCIAVAVDGMFNFPLHIPVSAFLFWVMLGTWVQFCHGARMEFPEPVVEPVEQVKPREIPRVKPTPY